MTALRQRLLLVAGWVVAAVVAGLVSAGAVAVAGGQVNDRPLNPVSAADVAALPVLTAGDCGDEPPASGGYTLLLRCLDLAGGSIGDSATVDRTAQPAQKEFPPVNGVFVPDGRSGHRSTGGYYAAEAAQVVTPAPR